MARESKKMPTNNAGRPTGSYSSYGTSGYGAPYGGGYGSVGNGAYGGRSPYGAPPVQPVASMNNNVANNEVQNAKGNKKAEKAAKATKEPKETKANKADYGNMSRKQKNLAKKQEKFDENDLRNYPMKVGTWIGTFILLAIPVIGQICAICWFFGVGNRSRAAWIRSKVVAFLLIILLIVTMFGVGYGVLASKAKNVEVVFGEESYGKLGDYGAKGTVYYVACLAIDTFGEQIIGQFIGGGETGGQEGEESSGDDMKVAIKAMLAEKLLGIKFSNSEEGEGGDQGVISGGDEEVSGGDDEELAA